MELGFPDDSDGKESDCSVGDLGLILGSGRYPGEGNGYPPWLFLPGEFHGQRRLAGYSPWGHKESDTTELVTLVWLIHFVVQQKLTQHCKATVPQFKKMSPSI